jgi:stage II sporulation protein M
MRINMTVIMTGDERRAYIKRLRPYLMMSLFLFGAGFAAGLMVVSHYPALNDQFEQTITTFVSAFSGMPRLKLAGAIFLNNAAKTLFAIVLGALLGIVPAIFLFANGIALAVAWSLSSRFRGAWLSLLSILPHGVIELLAVFLGTGIGLMIGAQALRRFTGKSAMTIGAELRLGLRFFCSVLVPLLLLAAFVEAFITTVLISPR